MASWPVVSALALACLGLALSYFGYVLGPVSINVNELVGTGVFWCAVVFLLLTIPLRKGMVAASKYIRTSFGKAVFAFYFVFHLLLYGFLFEAVLAAAYGVHPFVTAAGLYVSTNVFVPPSVESTIFDIAYNPTITLVVPPVFSMVLSFYGLSAAVIISTLVLANIGRVRELSKVCTTERKARTFVILPAIGLVFGASCCLSVAALVSLFPPAAAILTSSAWVYYGTYFFFPAIAAVLLYLNLRSIENISSSIRPIRPIAVPGP